MTKQQTQEALSAYREAVRMWLKFRGTMQEPPEPLPASYGLKSPTDRWLADRSLREIIDEVQLDETTKH